MVGDPIPDIAKAALKLREGWNTLKAVLPFLPLIGIGVALAALLALWQKPDAMHVVLPIPNYFILLDELWFWWVILLVLLMLSVVAVGHHVQRRIKVGVEDAQPSVATLKRAEEFIQMLGRISPRQLDLLATLADFDGPMTSTGALDELHRAARDMIQTDGSRVFISEQHRGFAQGWVKGQIWIEKPVLAADV